MSNSLTEKKPFLFFFSYARADAEGSDYLIKFFLELRNEVREQTGLPLDEIGFRDTANIKTGDYWSDELIDALQTSRVMVCLSSPTYINREFCGKEFQVFLDRLALYEEINAPKEPPRAILPIIWTPIKGEMPKALSDRQLHDDDLPEEYRVEGLRYLLKLTKKRDQYEEFLTSFAEKIIEAAQGPELPPLDPPPSLESVQSTFHQADAMAEDEEETKEAGSGGPNNAKFIFVAASQDEIGKVRKKTGGYDEQGGWFWRPFLPAEKKTIGRIAQDVASEEDMRYHELPLDERIVQRLKRADEKNEIIIIVVDAWSMKIPEYRKIMRLYDGEGFLNCAVLIPWNDKDAETNENMKGLNDALTVTFKVKAAAKHPVYFNDAIYSADDLRGRLRNTLNAIKLKIIEVREAEKRIEGEAKPTPAIPVPAGEEASA